METRELLKLVVALLDDEGAELPETADEEAAERQPRKPDYEPSPDAIRSAMLEIQAGWSDDDRLIRSGMRSQPRRWIVPRVKLGQPLESED